MDETLRIATQLEVKHYVNLVRPITDYLQRHKPPGDELPVEMKPLTEAILSELSRFGYVPTPSCHLVEIGDSRLDDPVLTPQQQDATRADLSYVWKFVRGKRGHN